MNALEGLPEFLAVAESQSFTAAARSLGVSTSLVSRRVATLEARLGVQLVARYGHPQKPQDLRQHNCLIFGNFERWRFETPEGPEEVRVSGNWRSNNSPAIVEACRRGMGIAYIQRSNFGAALQDAQLEVTLEPYWARGTTSWIVYPSSKYLPTRARLAVDYLLDRFRDWQEL